MSARGGWFVLPLLAIAAPPGVSQEAVGRQPDRLTLVEAARSALATHPSAGLARAEEAAAGGSLREARGPLFPRLSAEGSITRFEEPMIVAPLHGFDPASPPTFDETLIGGNLTLSWTLFDGGSRGARIRSARERAAAAGEGTAAAEQGLIAAVAAAYLEALTAGGVLEAQERRIAALEAELERVGRLAAEGRAAEVERLRVEASRSEAVAERVRAESRRTTAERTLARLIGVPPEAAAGPRLVGVRLADGSEPSEELGARGRELARRAQERSPALAKARRRLLAAAAERGAARAAWFPEIRLQGGALGFGSGAGDFTTEWRGGASLSYPLFTGGARAGAVARAAALEAGAGEEVRLAHLEVGESIDRALATASAASARAEALSAAARHLAEVARIERLALEEGVGVQTDYLGAEAELEAARAALIEARHEEIEARVELARLIGDLSPEWLAANLEEIR